MKRKTQKVNHRKRIGGRATKVVKKHNAGRSRGRPKRVERRAARAKTRVEKRPETKSAAAKESVSKKKGKDYIPTLKEATAAIGAISSDRFALDYINKNVSKNAFEVLNAITTPKTDEQISLLLNMKINFVRRMLNIMQGYGITNYYIAKNNNGWLSFAWYINATKLQGFFDYIKSIRGDDVVITENCNDYFICGKCYDDAKLIFDFDAAFEARFKCGACGGKFKMISRDEAQKLVDANTIEANQ